MFSLPICLCATYVAGPSEVRRGIGSLELELQIAVSHCVGIGN